MSTTRVYKAAEIEQDCTAALANIEAQILREQEEEIQRIVAELKRFRLEKAKCTWYRWFPKPFVEPTRDDAHKHASDMCEYYFENSITSIPQRYKTLKSNITRVLIQAQNLLGSASDNLITIGSDDYRQIHNWQ